MPRSLIPVVLIMLLLIPLPVRATPVLETVNGSPTGRCLLSNEDDLTADYLRCLEWVHNRWLQPKQLYQMTIVFPGSWHSIDPSGYADGFNLCSTTKDIFVEGNGTNLTPKMPPTGVTYPVFLRASTPTRCHIRDLKLDIQLRAEIGFLGHKGPTSIDGLEVIDAAHLGILIRGSVGNHYGTLTSYTRVAAGAGPVPRFGVALISCNELTFSKISAAGFTGDGVTICGNGACPQWRGPELIQGDGYVSGRVYVESHSETGPANEYPERTQLYAGLKSYTTNGVNIERFYAEIEHFTPVVLDGMTMNFSITGYTKHGKGTPTVSLPWAGSSRIKLSSTSDEAYAQIQVRRSNPTDPPSAFNTIELLRQSWRPRWFERLLPTRFVDAEGAVLWTAYGTDASPGRSWLAQSPPPAPDILSNEPFVFALLPAELGFTGWQWDPHTATWKEYGHDTSSGNKSADLGF